MKKLFLLSFSIIILFSSCQNDPIDVDETCVSSFTVYPPIGYEILEIGEIGEPNLGEVITSYNYVDKFQFVNENLGYASYNDGSTVEIYKTYDGGKSWEKLNIDLQRFPQGIHFIDENVGLILSFQSSISSLLYITKDGGETWIEHDVEELNGYFIELISDEEGNLYGNFISQGSVDIFKSNDQGMTWDTIFSSFENKIELIPSLLQIENEIIYFLSRENELIGINDQGNIVRRIKTFTENINGISFVNEDVIVIETFSLLRITNNGGASWSSITDLVASIIDFDENGNGLILAPACPNNLGSGIFYFLSTTNEGIDWEEPQRPTIDLNYRGVEKISDGRYYVFIGKKLFEVKKV